MPRPANTQIRGVINPMQTQKSKFPYFDLLISLLDQGNPIVEHAFGHHVHWGHWQDPTRATLAVDDFAATAENLSQKVYSAGNVRNGQKVLDVGCGFGGTIASMNENFTGMQLAGLNIENDQLRRAVQSLNKINGNSIGFTQGDACSLPFPNQYFDVVLAVECIFHFPDRLRFFQEAARVLIPGGYLALSDILPATFTLPLTALSLTRPVARGFYGLCNFQCTLAYYRRIAKTAGFEIRLEENITTNTLPTYPFLRKIRKDLGIRTISGAGATLAAELGSRMRILRYMVLSFKKEGG